MMGPMVPEARLEPTEEGLVAAGDGWFVLNATEARWRHRPERGHSLPFEGMADFAQVEVVLYMLGPGEPIGIYHSEVNQEDFFVLSGEALLLIEGQERPLRQWDFVHCPPDAQHMIIGAGDGPCVVLAIGACEHGDERTWGAYTVDPIAQKHGVGVAEETSDADVAYAPFADPYPARYPGGL